MSTEGKVIKCQAAVAWTPNKPLSIETIEVDPPKAGEVRIKMVSTGICHSDLFFLKGIDPRLKFPVVLGHEGAGIVESIGEGVTTVKAGDHVIPLWLPQCRTCKFCTHPKGTNLCDKFQNSISGTLLDGTTRLSCKGKSLSQMTSTSTFSEYTVVSEIAVSKINDKADLNKASLIGCCVPTGYGAAVNGAKIDESSVCAIWGLGGVGMCVAVGCRAQGAKRIIGIDINPDKFVLAKKFGCTEFVNPKDYDKPIHEVLIEMTNGGLDYAFVSVGNAAAMNSAFLSLHEGWGEAILIGITEQKFEAIPWDLLMGRVVKGTLCGGWRTRDSIPDLVDKYVDGKLMVDELISHTFTLKNINEAFDKLRSGEALRSVVLYE